MADKPPRAFISYSWTSKEHESWVLTLASELRASGADVVLDRWDLKEGHDAHAFMEKMVTDPDVSKVIMVCDRRYAEKADGRQGGVGAEAQIISPELYGETTQDKFVAVVSELGKDNKPFLPAYYASRIYIDLSSDEVYAANFEQLLRWIFDKPAFVKPQIGKPPAYLDDASQKSIPSAILAKKAITEIKAGSSSAPAALEDYLSTLAGGLEEFRMKPEAGIEIDDLVIKSVDEFLHYRNEFISVISAAARYGAPETIARIHDFFEKAAPYLERPPEMNSWAEWDFDNFRFIIQELFLYSIAILLQRERFSEVGHLLSTEYYILQDGRKGMYGFTVFRNYLRSLERRNSRLDLRRLSVAADMLEKRAKSSGIEFEILMQADFLLYLRSIADNPQDRYKLWWPDSLLYASRMHHPFEIFARAKSHSYFSKLAPALGVEDAEDFLEILEKFRSGDFEAPKWEWDRLDVLVLAGADELAKT